jgi:hypothetical protein
MAAGGRVVSKMLLGIAIATIALVAACVVSVVFRPDPEALRPIDGGSREESGEPQPEVADARTEEDPRATDDPGRTAG